MSNQALNRKECQHWGKAIPSPCTSNCDLAVSVLSPMADTSPSLLGKCLNAIWHRVLMRNAGRSTNCPLLNDGKLLPSSGLLRSQRCATQRQKGAGIEPGNESTWGKRASMTHPVQPPDTTLQSSISASYPVRSQLDKEAVAGATQCSSGDWVTEVKGSASNNANPGICYLQIANSSFPNITVCALASLMSSLS